MALKELPIHPLEFTEYPEQLIQRLIAQYGDAFAYESGHGLVYVFNHPDQVDAINRSANFVRTAVMTGFLGYGLLTNEGDYWQKQRRTAQPVFHKHCMGGFVDIINDATAKLVTQWQAIGGTTGGVVEDCSMPIRLCTMEVVMRALFSTDIRAVIKDWDHASQFLVNGVNPAFCSALNKVPKPNDINLATGTPKHAKYLDKQIYEIISKRRAESVPPRDLLTLLIHSEDKVTGESLSDLQIRDEIATMLMAGHETLAVSLGWAICELASQPVLRDQLSTEVDTVLQGEIPQLEHLTKMPKLVAFLDEVLRVYPSIPFIFRRAVVTDTIDGYTIPADGLILISPYTLHRHKDFWPQPETFNIDNFSHGKNKQRHNCAYMPFTTGKHTCIGKEFALMEGKLILAHILLKIDILGLSGAKPVVKSGLTLQAESPISLKISRR